MYFVLSAARGGLHCTTHCNNDTITSAPVALAACTTSVLEKSGCTVKCIYTPHSHTLAMAAGTYRLIYNREIPYGTVSVTKRSK